MKINIFEFIDKTKLISFAFMLIFFLVFAFVIWTSIFGLFFATQSTPTVLSFILFIFSLYFFVLIFYLYGNKLVLLSVKARKANTRNLKERSLIESVEELSLATGIKTPRVYIMKSSDINAFVMGRDFGHCYICVTDGSLRYLNREELSSIVAHEIIRIKNYDTAIKAFIYPFNFILFIMVISISTFSRSSYLNDWMDLVFGISVVLDGVFEKIIRERQILADTESVELTKNPEALITTLRKVEVVNPKEPSLKTFISSLLLNVVVIPFTDSGNVDFNFLYKRINLLKSLSS